MNCLISKKRLIFSLILIIFISLINTDVYAKTMTPNEIQGSSYVIGTHIFTRETNDNTGYEGKLTTNLIMLASQTIETSNLESMIIYYKTATGMWINGLTGLSIEPPTSFNIDYTNLELDENSVVSKPIDPILELQGPLYIDDETDMMSYQLDIYIDDVDNNSNKIDGVEIFINDNSHGTTQDLNYNDSFKEITTIQNSYKGDKLEIGKTYHRSFITFENKTNGIYTISARSYVKNAKDEKIYSEPVTVSVNSEVALPYVKIINDYTNPDYINFDGQNYTYKLKIEQPDAYVFKIQPERFAYIIYEKESDAIKKNIGIYSLDDSFTVEVPKDSIKTYFARIGYYDKDGTINFYDGETDKYYIIDTRKTITTPILKKNYDSFDENFEDGERITIDQSIYNKASEDSLDYLIEGAEFYEVNYDGYNISNFKYIDDNNYFFTTVKPETGIASYVSRVYAINSLGQKIYSNFSNVLTVIMTPEIEVSEVSSGSVNVSLKNIAEYGTGTNLQYKVFNDSDTELTGLKNLNEIANINIDSSTEIYIRIYKSSDESIYSSKSNKIMVTP